MTAIDWLIVVLVNGAIVGYGLLISRGTKKASDWFLAARGLPWWMVGLSMFATAVDSGDYVAVVGGAYTFGLSNLTTWWLGMPIGWFIVSYGVFLPLYRSGMYTNAEYLEHRFGPSVRVMSALIQVQNRTNVLGNIAFSLYLTFSILTGWGSETWWLVVVIAAAAAAYTATGGLKSVAMTDALQSVLMFIAALVLWLTVWNVIGGWSGLEDRFASIDPDLSRRMMHVGGEQEPGVPPMLVVFGWIITLTAYCVVNHSQAMRMLAARSEWDMKMAAVVASFVTAAVMWFNITLGVMGRAIYPEIESVDRVFPLLVQDFLAPGLIGVVVGGVLAGGISTYDSIGSSVAAVFTRDIYARFLVRDGDDAHYLRVSRLATPVIIALSFAYVPFLQSGMIGFYLRLAAIAVIPLFTVTLMGVLTRVHRGSGVIGLAAGMAYGLSSFLGATFHWPLPVWWTNTWWAYLWGVILTAGTMCLYSALRGWASDKEISGLVLARGDGGGRGRLVPPLAATKGSWLETTREELADMPSHPFTPGVRGSLWYNRPSLWVAAFLLIASLVCLRVLW
jgi:SSS family solute:Na+ symporter